MGADTKANTMGGGGVPQGGDLRLLEDGRECRGALSFDRVQRETAKEGWGEEGESKSVKALTQKQTLRVGSRSRRTGASLSSSL